MRSILESYESALFSARRLKPLASTSWASKVPSEAGVYIIWDRKKPIYVGQTSSLSARMNDLAKPINHTFSRKTCKALDIDEKCVHELAAAISSKYKLSYVQVPFGRAEVEEYLVLRWRKFLINKPARRLLRSPQYNWVAAV